MRKVMCHQSISLDGFTAGPNQSPDNPIGEGGMRLHEWMFTTAAWAKMQGGPDGTEGPGSAVVEEIAANTRVRATIMGRNMLASGHSHWHPDRQRWWGD